MNHLAKEINISSDALVQEIDNEMIILNVKTERYFGLDSVAMDMWKRLEKHKNPQAVITEMLHDYDIDEKTLSQDIDQFLDSLNQAGLISLN